MGNKVENIIKTSTYGEVTQNLLGKNAN